MPDGYGQYNDVDESLQHISHGYCNHSNGVRLKLLISSTEEIQYTNLRAIILCSGTFPAFSVQRTLNAGLNAVNTKFQNTTSPTFQRALPYIAE